MNQFRSFRQLSAVHQLYAGWNGGVIRDTSGLHSVGYVVMIILSKELKLVYTSETLISSKNMESNIFFAMKKYELLLL